MSSDAIPGLSFELLCGIVEAIPKFVALPIPEGREAHLEVLSVRKFENYVVIDTNVSVKDIFVVAISVKLGIEDDELVSWWVYNDTSDSDLSEVANTTCQLFHDTVLETFAKITAIKAPVPEGEWNVFG
jgi:hypothetical protein